MVRGERERRSGLSFALVTRHAFVLSLVCYCAAFFLSSSLIPLGSVDGAAMGDGGVVVSCLVYLLSTTAVYTLLALL